MPHHPENKNMLEGKFKPRRYKGRQYGGGIAGMYSKKPYMIPVNPHTATEESRGKVGKQATPMAAVEERAKEDLNEEIRDNVPYVPVGNIFVCLFVCLFIAARAIFQLSGGCHHYR
jgi:hypothetical protein